MRPVPRVAVCITAALCACTSGRQVNAGQSASVSALTADQICRSAATEAQSVVAAHLTTVGHVRDRRGGPGNGSPAGKPWAKLRGGSPAAWCSFKTASGYFVAAATPGARLVTFIYSKDMIDPGSGGPAIP
jgi:hypothetical protein